MGIAAPIEHARINGVLRIAGRRGVNRRGHGVLHEGSATGLRVTMMVSGDNTRGLGWADYPPGPDGLTAYLLGDIHGRLDLLIEAHRLIDEDKARSRPARPVEVYLGDYIDRGPDPAGVVSRLVSRARDVEAVFLRGNHEQLLLEFIAGKDCLRQWQSVGGTTTMLSYGLEPSMLLRLVTEDVVRRHISKNLPDEHLEFLKQTGSFIAIGPYLAVHAGIRPGIGLEDQKVADLLGIRREFLDHDGEFGFIVVHGHTPVSAPELRRNRINIDTGAFATNRLTCLRIGEDGVRVLTR